MVPNMIFGQKKLYWIVFLKKNSTPFSTLCIFSQMALNKWTENALVMLFVGPSERSRGARAARAPGSLLGAYESLAAKHLSAY